MDAITLLVLVTSGNCFLYWGPRIITNNWQLTYFINSPNDTQSFKKQFSICAFQMGNINSICFSMHSLESIGTLVTAVEWERGIEVRYDQRNSFQLHLFSFFAILKLLNNDFEKLDLMFFCYREESYFRFSHFPAFNITDIIRTCFVRRGFIDSTNIPTNIELFGFINITPAIHICWVDSCNSSINSSFNKSPHLDHWK